MGGKHESSVASDANRRRTLKRRWWKVKKVVPYELNSSNDLLDRQRRMATTFFAPLDLTRPGQFDHRKAAHLLRRAGFGASPAEVSQAVDQGLEVTVDALLADNAEQEQEFEQTFASVAGSLVNVDDVEQVQAWWVYRMLKTRA